MSEKLREFYAQSKPHDTGFLKVSDLHTIYWEEHGNPDGIPVVYLHGGPGGGIPDYAVQLFDPEAFRIVLADQRGAGKSTPLAEMRENTPDLLVEDIETLRTHVGIDQWHVVGGSWGSTLALLYAETHPNQCLSIVLRGVYLMTASEIHWFMNDMAKFFPNARQAFNAYIPSDEHGDLMQAYYARLTSDDSKTRLAAAHAWVNYEGACAELAGNDNIDEPSTDAEALSMATAEAHYFLHNRFTPDDRILKNCETIKDIPTFIINGRYDCICPPHIAQTLHHALQNSQLDIVFAGHATKDPAIRDSMIQACDRIRDTGSPLKL